MVHTSVRNKRAMYQVDQMLGRGAFGIVYHLRINGGNEFALKVAEIGRLHKDIIDSATEAKLMLKLSHAHLVQCCASFSHGQFVYLVMELCRFGTLKNFLSTRTVLVRETQVLAWLGQIADALRYLHVCRVIHRDLKTDNVFLDDRNNVKVGDLGIARELDYTAQKAGTFIGTFCYMSPEVLQGSTYSYETDIWSLGCCIHEVMTLRQTFAAQSMMEVMDNIMESRVPPMPDVYSHKLQDLVLQMLEKEPKNRPDGLEILLAVSKIQGFPFTPGPFERLENIEINHKLLVKAVQTFELKSSRNKNTMSHRHKSSFQHSETFTQDMAEDSDVGSVVLSEEQHLTVKTKVPSRNQHVHMDQDVLRGSERKLTLQCGNVKEDQNHISELKKISDGDKKVQNDVPVPHYPVFNELSSPSHFTSSNSVDVLSASSSLSSVNDSTTDSTEKTLQTFSQTSGTAGSFDEYMDCLARESQQWLREKFGLLEKRNPEAHAADDDSDNSVTLYTRAQVVKYNNRKYKSNQFKSGTGP
ncbi:hypothetical protein BsWGS_11422 [Bradybaena similaris]